LWQSAAQTHQHQAPEALRMSKSTSAVATTKAAIEPITMAAQSRVKVAEGDSGIGSTTVTENEAGSIARGRTAEAGGSAGSECSAGSAGTVAGKPHSRPQTIPLQPQTQAATATAYQSATDRHELHAKSNQCPSREMRTYTLHSPGDLPHTASAIPSATRGPGLQHTAYQQQPWDTRAGERYVV